MGIAGWENILIEAKAWRFAEERPGRGGAIFKMKINKKAIKYIKLQNIYIGEPFNLLAPHIYLPDLLIDIIRF